MAIIILLNSIVFLADFILSGLLAGFIYTAIKAGPILQSDLLFIFVLVICLLFFYIFFLAGLIIYFRIVLSAIPEREYIFDINEDRRSYIKNELRVILDAIILGVGKPLIYLFPSLLRVTGAKIGKNFVMTGKFYNSDIAEVGDNVVIGDYVMISCHLTEGTKKIFKKVKIGNGCTIGGQSAVMPGVEMGDNSMIAAGAMVSKDTFIPP
jgi:Acetyltransferase (isoleucine patch superfamily)